ncbi:MAG: ThiF family adenylyltransferase [Leifsonia sp.]
MASSVDPSSRRFARQHVLAGFGLTGQRALAEAHVLVLGAGGIGSSVIPALAAAGVGTLSLVDDDRVEESNLPRQTVHTASDVGRLKVDSAADAIARLSADTRVLRHPVRFDAEAASTLLVGVDVIVDGSDTLETRYAANDAAALHGIPLVWGSAVGYGAQVGVAWDARGVDYRDLFPERPAEEGPTCELVGVLPMVCGVAGALMAAEAVKLITGIGAPLLGRVAVYDAMTGRTREISYERDPHRRATPASRVPAPLHGAPAPTPESGRVADRPAPSAGPRSLTAAELRDALASDDAPLLLDVREDWEAAIAELPGSVRIPLGDLAGRVSELDPDAAIVVYCHLGVRSARAIAVLEQSGFQRVAHLDGGIEAWSMDVDPAIRRY